MAVAMSNILTPLKQSEASYGVKCGKTFFVQRKMKESAFAGQKDPKNASESEVLTTTQLG